MHEIDVTSAEAYLRASGRVGPDEEIVVRELAGGVSNVVLHVSRPSGADFVLKQARGQLRVEQPWYCSVERIWREIDTLAACGKVLGKQRAGVSDAMHVEVPQLLFEDRANYLYAMTAAPPHTVWKSQLLAGEASDKIACACGEMLGALHGGTWRKEEVAAQFADRQFFEALRLDPYYRRVAAVYADLSDQLVKLIDSLAANACCLVHGDFSPKNLLVYGRHLMLVDFEVGHYGDPAFDLGFFLSHLVLKSVYAGAEGERFLALTETFWQAYLAALRPHVEAHEVEPLITRAITNFAGCALARIDGKSPVEYLREPSQRDHVRNIARAVLQKWPSTWEQMLEMARTF